MTDTKQCPYCAETIRAEAVKCRFCGSLVDPTASSMLSAPWLRRREGRLVAGVCIGLAEQFGISVTIVRLAFALGTLLSGGVAVLLYIALWLAMPLEPEPYPEEHLSLDRAGGEGRPPSGPPF